MRIDEASLSMFAFVLAIAACFVTIRLADPSWDYDAKHPLYCTANKRLVSVQPVASWTGSASDLTLTFDDGSVASANQLHLWYNDLTIGADYCKSEARR